MAVGDDIDSKSAQRILLARSALLKGTLKVAPHLQALADEVASAPLTITGLVNVSHLSPEAIRFAEGAGMGLRHFREPEVPSPSSTSMAELQSELFALFARLFGALTGRAVTLVKDEAEIRDRMLWRVRHEPGALPREVNPAADAIESFYRANAAAIFTQAKHVGGMRLVSGGQRRFGPSALRGVRLTSLYADTQLIPDPIYPYFCSELHLTAMHLQLAIALFYVLQLRPLVDAKFPVPPVIVFPSFEENLEEFDAHTKIGLERLVVRVVEPVCDGSVGSLDELFEYAQRNGDDFAQALLNAGLFVPPGGTPGQTLDVAEAAHQYLKEIAGYRSAENLELVKRLSVGTLFLNGVLERLRPQYHLLENANEFGAQPLLSQAVHWHYFETCSRANALQLVRNKVLTEQAFQTLRAIQDDSLSWLAHIDIETIKALIANGEHRWLRHELNGYTDQLAASGAMDVDSMVKEVTHGLSSLVQRQRESMAAIEAKYAPGNAAAVAAGAAGVGMAAVVALLPSLSPILGVSVPAAAALGAAGAAATSVARSKVAEWAEKRKADRSMLGVLATVRRP